MSPYDRQRQLDRRDAAPRADKISWTLQRRRRRRMIARDEAERTALEPVPQRLTVTARSNRWRAFEFCRAVGNLVVGDREIVRACFARDADAACACRGNRIDT